MNDDYIDIKKLPVPEHITQKSVVLKQARRLYDQEFRREHVNALVAKDPVFKHLKGEDLDVVLRKLLSTLVKQKKLTRVSQGAYKNVSTEHNNDK